MSKKIFFVLSVVVFLGLGYQKVEAHQPVIVPEGTQRIEVTDPEVSKAYYAELIRDQQYIIRSDKPFKLYLNLLVPRDTNLKGNYSAAIIRENAGKFQEVGRLEGGGYFWTEYFEPFGRDYYMKSGEVRTEVPEGVYYISVYGSNDKGKDMGKYVLAIGEKEVFSPLDVYSSIKKIAWLKQNFFNSSPLTLILSPFGAAFAIIALLIGGVVGVIIRALSQEKKNLGVLGRLVRLVAFALLGFGGVYFWSLILLIASGYILLEIISGWSTIPFMRNRIINNPDAV